MIFECAKSKKSFGLGVFILCAVSFQLVSDAQSRLPEPDSMDSTRLPQAKQASEKHIKEGIKFLFAQQHDSGLWKSEYYGNLKEGAAITSLVLFSLSHCDPKLIEDRKPDIAKAFLQLKAGIVRHGYVANKSGPDYANYASALTLLAAKNFKRHWGLNYLTPEESKKLSTFLTSSQLDETHGLASGQNDYGGWDLSGWMREPRPSPGTNISISSFVLLALQPDSSDKANKARDKNRHWIKRVQNADHGFHFHPKKDHSGNKAEWFKSDFTKPNSYGSATVDGIRAMRALGMKQDKIDKAATWISRNSDPKAGITFVPGFEFRDKDRNGSWGQGLLYYYLMGLALEQDSLPKSFQTKCRQQIPAFLVAAQKKNGSWENTSARMREDDPMIATSFALIALSKLSEKK